MTAADPLSMAAALGRPVIARDTADEIGEVKAFVVAGSGRQIERIQVAGRTRNAQLVDWSDIATFGPDAVMVVAHDGAHEPVDDRDQDVVRGTVEVIGARILDTAGFEHGRVVDFEFDAATGAVLGVVGDGGHIVADRIHALGSWALVVDPG